MHYPKISRQKCFPQFHQCITLNFLKVFSHTGVRDDNLRHMQAYRQQLLTVKTRVTLCFQSCLLPILNIAATICSVSGLFQNDLLTPGRPTQHPTGLQMKSPLEDLRFTFTLLICIYCSPGTTNTN